MAIPKRKINFEFYEFFECSKRSWFFTKFTNFWKIIYFSTKRWKNNGKTMKNNDPGSFVFHFSHSGNRAFFTRVSKKRWNNNGKTIAKQSKRWKQWTMMARQWIVTHFRAPRLRRVRQRYIRVCFMESVLYFYCASWKVRGQEGIRKILEIN